MASISGQRGAWQVRWREPSGVGRKKTFRRKIDAQRFAEARQADRQAWEKIQPRLRGTLGSAAGQTAPRMDDSVWADLLVSAGGFAPAGWWVYMLWARKGDAVPLYVGSSGNVMSRLGTHFGDEAKRSRVGWVSLISCASMGDMLARENALIRELRPAWNRFVPSSVCALPVPSEAAKCL